MDNYFNECPPMMDDGRLFTDYRSSQVREEIFRYQNCAASENEARMLRTEYADVIMDNEWDYLRNTHSCFPNKKCYHQNPITRVNTLYNNAELLAYNKEIPAPKCDAGCYDFRLTVTKGSLDGKKGCKSKHMPLDGGYPPNRCPNRCARTNRLVPEYLYMIDGIY